MERGVIMYKFTEDDLLLVIIPFGLAFMYACLYGVAIYYQGALL